MTKQLYHENSYLKEFDAVVTDVEKGINGVVLDRTAFFPGGGGQPPDFGVIETEGTKLHIERAKRHKGDIFHLIDEGGSLPDVGNKVQGKINWPHRYELMRTHTAMHILCGVIWSDYEVSVTGADMEPLKGRMDFEFETMQKSLINSIEQAINVEVRNERPVSWRKLPREEAFQIPDLIRTKINLLPDHIQQVRVVEIKGLDLQADGGTHVKNTSEVGEINIYDYKSKGKMNKRIYFELGNEG